MHASHTAVQWHDTKLTCRGGGGWSRLLGVVSYAENRTIHMPCDKEWAPQAKAIGMLMQGERTMLTKKTACNLLHAMLSRQPSWLAQQHMHVVMPTGLL